MFSTDDCITIYKDYENDTWHIEDKQYGLITVPFGFLSIDCLNQLKLPKCPASQINEKYNLPVWNYLKYAVINKKDKTPSFRFMLSDLTLHTVSSDTDTVPPYMHSLAFISEHLHKKCAFWLSAELRHNCHHSAYSKYIAQIIFYSLLPEPYLADSEIPDIIQSLQAKIWNYTNDTPASMILNKIEDSYFIHTGLTTPSWSNSSVSLETFKTPHLLFLLPQDVVAVNTPQYTLSSCSNCSAVFIRKHKSQKYCQSCGCHATSYHTRTYQRQQPRRLHETIRNKLKALYGPESQEYRQFLTESNFYWNMLNCQTQKTPQLATYNTEIMTEEKYTAWLKAQLAAVENDKDLKSLYKQYDIVEEIRLTAIQLGRTDID